MASHEQAIWLATSGAEVLAGDGPEVDVGAGPVLSQTEGG